MNKEIDKILEDYDSTGELVELIKDKDEEIRDLQEENKKLKDRIHALEEHNKHLEKEAQKYFDKLMDCEYANKDTYDTANDIAGELFKEKEEMVQYACDLEDKICNLNGKINKAIEYIETQQKIFKDYDIVIENQLKNIEIILKGDE